MVQFTSSSARAYLAGFAVWLTGWIIVMAEYAGHETVRSATEGVQLAAMIVAAMLIFGLALQSVVARQRPVTFTLPDLAHVGAVSTVLTWLLLVGGGIPAAARVLRGVDHR